MNQVETNLPEMKLVGIKTRTNNVNAFIQDPSVNKIAIIVQKYFHGGLPQKIPHRKKAGVTYCVYTEYESDFNGDYTYFIGEEVDSFDEVPEGFSTLTIPAQKYAKFTNESGPMPDVGIDMWQKIWAMTPDEFGGNRGYRADFEVYDERAMDHQNAVLDIYIGL